MHFVSELVNINWFSVYVGVVIAYRQHNLSLTSGGVSARGRICDKLNSRSGITLSLAHRFASIRSGEPKNHVIAVDGGTGVECDCFGV